jgi:hypothetical protein
MPAKKKITPKDRDRILHAKAEGATLTEISQSEGLAVSTVHGVIHSPYGRSFLLHLRDVNRDRLARGIGRYIERLVEVVEEAKEMPAVREAGQELMRIAALGEETAAAGAVSREPISFEEAIYMMRRQNAS